MRGTNKDEMSDSSKQKLLQPTHNVFNSDRYTASTNSPYKKGIVSTILHSSRGRHSTRGSGRDRQWTRGSGRDRQWTRGSGRDGHSTRGSGRDRHWTRRSDRGRHWTRGSLEGRSYIWHSNRIQTNNIDQAPGYRGRGYSGRSNRGSRMLRGTGRQQQTSIDDDIIEQFLQKVEPSVGADKAEAVYFLVSRSHLINEAIKTDRNRERLLRSIKFALSLEIAPQLSSLLVDTLMKLDFVKTVCPRLEKDMFKLTRASECWFVILSDLIDILKQLFDFQTCTESFLSSSTSCLTKLLYEAKRREFIPEDGVNEKVLYKQTDILDMLMKRRTSETSVVVSGDLEGESEDISEYVKTTTIFPRIADLQFVPKLFPINKNVGYKSFKDYMYIQYSLLREDFVGPLRDGIRQFQSKPIKHREKRGKHEPKNTYSNIRVYDNVKIVSMVCDQGLNYVVTFDTSKLRYVRWDSTGRLKYGSLVCLSHDNFFSMLVGVVVKADSRQRGELHVKFNDTVNDHNIKEWMNNLFTMVEPTAYFEAYRHVLLKCKNMHQSDMSMFRYIVHCQQEILLPRYLRENPDALFDLRTLCKKDMKVLKINALAPFMKPEDMPITEESMTSNSQGSSYEKKRTLEKKRNEVPDANAIGQKTILTKDRHTYSSISNQSSTCEGMSNINITDVLYDENDVCSEADIYSSTDTNVEDQLSSFKKVEILKEWPHYVTERFDASQINAVKSALTRELSIIQGPPGCGKTYIGLEIVKVMLKNESLWKTSPGDGPILVLCYTNHALDQFMEGISNSFTGGILRVGSRSNSATLHKCNLKNIRKNMRAQRSIPDYIYKGKKAALGHIYESRHQRIVATKKITILKENIIHENALYTEMGPDIAKQFKWRSRVVYRKSSITNLVITSMIYDWLGIDDISREVEYMIKTYGIDNVIKTDKETQQHEEIDALLETDTSLQYFLPEDFISFKDKDITNELEEYTKKYVALNIASLSESPTDVDVSKSEIMRWHRLELIKKLREKLRRKEHKIVAIYPGSDIYDLTMDERWCIFKQWIDKKCCNLNEEIENGIIDYKSAHDNYNEVLMLENRYIMKMADVIGITTTCAAKHSLELQDINAKILIIEEAAEILESHLVTNIGKGCDQLILIGDHQQLRPKHSYHKLAKQFNIDISMFERLISSGLEYTTLTHQHRMAPVIANNIRHIYPDLEDHIAVKEYDDVLGMKHSMVFLNHSHIEESKDGTMSKKNNFEATFSIALATYFIQQGYKPSQVTILTTYKTQMFEIMTLRKDVLSLRGVKVTVVDNFQGEECDIIILSLVRSNLEGNIGFLADDNRVCVALSRAKYGLYVLGNIEMYHTPLWQNILTSQSTKDLVQQELQLKCQNHPSAEPNLVSKVKDFAKVPEGGCLLPCEFVLSCGHNCPKQCHIVDKEHNEVICQMPCERKCENGHDCNLICGKTCLCEEDIEARPTCGHAFVLKCYQEIVCPHMCEKELTCGHVCKKKCVDQCEPCEALVERKLQCGHLVDLPCHTDTLTYVCKQPCVSVMECGHNCPATCGTTKNKNTACYGEDNRTFTCEREHVSFCYTRCDATLACGHICTGTCSQCFCGKQHIPCIQECKHSLICNHACPGTCNSCEPCKETCERWCQHKQCSEKCSDICSKCTELCGWKCPHYACTNRCSEPCNRPRCDWRCPEKLRCGHKCIGLCGEPCPIYCQRCKKDDFSNKCFGSQICPDGSFVLLEDCGHAVEYKLLDSYFDNDDPDELFLKQCPICFTPIYNCRRYGGKLNKLRDQIERMKKEIFWYTDSFDYILNKLNIRNVNMLKGFIINFRQNSIEEDRDIELFCNTSCSGTATKQWIQDCTNEMYRICDRMAISSVDQGKIGRGDDKEQFLLLEKDVRENMSSTWPYTADKRKKTIELVKLINKTTQHHVLLANVVIKLNWEGGDGKTHSHIFGSEIQSCKIDKHSANDGDDVKQINERLCIDSYSNTEADLQENEHNDTNSVPGDGVFREIGFGDDSKMDPTLVLDLPRTLSLFTLSCPEYFQCRKAPFPEEYLRITKSLSDDKRHDQRSRHDRRNDSIVNKRQRYHGEHSTSKHEANIETVYKRTHEHDVGRHSSRSGVPKRKEAPIRHTENDKGHAKRPRHDRRNDSIQNRRQSIQDHKRHDKKPRHDRRNDSTENKRQRYHGEHRTSKHDANIDTVYKRTHKHGTSRSSKGRVTETKEGHIRHTESKLVRRGEFKESASNIKVDIGQYDKHKSKKVGKKPDVTLFDTSKVAQNERYTEINTDLHNLSHKPHTSRESVFKRLGPRVSLVSDTLSPLQTNETLDHKNIARNLGQASIADLQPPELPNVDRKTMLTDSRMANVEFKRTLLEKTMSSSTCSLATSINTLSKNCNSNNKTDQNKKEPKTTNTESVSYVKQLEIREAKASVFENIPIKSESRGIVEYNMVVEKQKMDFKGNCKDITDFEIFG